MRIPGKSADVNPATTARGVRHQFCRGECPVCGECMTCGSCICDDDEPMSLAGRGSTQHARLDSPAGEWL